MSFGRWIALRMFGRPRGLLGRLGGAVMARMNRDCGAWAAGLLEVGAGERVLEVGFGPGVTVRHLAGSGARVAGVDPSLEMLAQATARNAAALRSGRVELRQGTAERLPFEADAFDRALAVNSLQVWSDAAAGLRELHRTLKPGGRVALAFTPHSGQSRDCLPELLRGAGFAAVRLVEADGNVCALAEKPSRA